MATLERQSTGGSAGTLPLQIGFDAPPAVLDALATMGRTEDVRFSPSGRRLVIACYASEQIAVADIEIKFSASGPEISVTSLHQHSSTALREPHGIDFLDDDTLIVANRAGWLVPFRLPSAGRDDVPVDGVLPPKLDSPGSVAVHSRGPGHAEVLACNNWENTVTRHVFDGNGTLSAGEVVVRRWLDLPDGIAMSRDGRWLAVSNHNSHSVFVYAYSTLNEHADPVAILRGVRYPHGLRFAADDRHLLVADAGAPHVHVFDASSQGWHGAGYPSGTITVMDDDTFVRGRHNSAEGGPKGIDVDPRTNVLIVTAERLPLAFFDLAPALDRGELDPVGDAFVGYELESLAATERHKAAAAAAKAELREMQQTRAWRLTAPARRAQGALLRLKRRRRG